MDHRESRSRTVRKLKARYSRLMKLTGAVGLIVGLGIGFFVGRITAPVVVAPEPTPAPTEAVELPEATAEVDMTIAEPTEVPATEAPTPKPTPVPTPEPTATPEPKEYVVAFGEVTPIEVVTDTETLNFTLEVKRLLTPEFYAENYATSYQLHGTEAGVEFELTLNDYMGGGEVIPQNLMEVTLEAEDGASVLGYQLTDKVIGGQSVSMQTNIPTLICKRYDYSQPQGDMKYLVVKTSDATYRFEVGEPLRPEVTPIPTVTYEPISVGMSGTEVVKLQTWLIEKGYLAGTADGNFGSMTEAAIKSAQAAFGQEVTGIADDAFQRALYGE